MDRCIVLTTIHPPSQAVRAWAALDGWRLVVAGDRKTPPNWQCPGGVFLSAALQDSLGLRLSRVLPWNHYCRKMVGYLHAIREGAGIILDTDDDNTPKNHWRLPDFQVQCELTPPDRGFVNVYGLFTTDTNIWPRGFPLNRIRQPEAALSADDLARQPVSVGVWQGLADGDPDVDAIYRLTNNTPCYFDSRPPVVLARGSLCPFNSQNTAFRREVFPLLYLPAHVTFRFTDILRGLVAQPILWQAGFHLGFMGATVVQERNPHDYLQDFVSELPCYLHAQDVPSIVQAAISSNCSVSDNLWSAYGALRKEGLVPEEELIVLDAWLQDLNR